MVDAVIGDARTLNRARKKSGIRRVMERKSTKAFLMASPLIILLGCLLRDVRPMGLGDVSDQYRYQLGKADGRRNDPGAGDGGADCLRTDERASSESAA